MPGALGRVAAAVYGAAVSMRNRRFDAPGRAERMPVPVLSVGNLSVGGTGKTPMVSHICSLLLQGSRRPAIAMRGYSRSRGRRPEDADEPDLYRRTLPAVPVLASPDRAAAIRSHLKGVPHPPTDCIVLDDGFQHRRVARDLDLVLIDATRSPFDDRLLPAGWLREPVESLRRATHVVITHAGMVVPERLVALAEQIHRVHGRTPLAMTRHVWTALRLGEQPQPLDWLLNRRVLAVCAIGNPGPFLADVRTHRGASPDAPSPEDEVVLGDHDPFSAATIAGIAARARERSVEAIIVTDKDWSKLRHAPPGALPCPVVRPVLSLSFLTGAAELERAVLSAASN